MTKRLFDIILSMIGLILSFPIGAIIALAIKLEDGGPIFYFQDRLGKNNKIFKILKFRSMVENAERDLGPVQAKMEDERVTGLGKILRATALDELPQLVNILKGDMSFVGPRALRPAECETGQNRQKSIYEFEWSRERLSALPGLTGVAQIFAARDICRREKFKYDMWYVKNRTFFLDLYLILLSFLITFKSKWEAEGNKFNFIGVSLKHRIERQLNE